MGEDVIPEGNTFEALRNIELAFQPRSSHFWPSRSCPVCSTLEFPAACHGLALHAHSDGGNCQQCRVIV
eukprot:5635105-Amphidinium_carterae.2